MDRTETISLLRQGHDEIVTLRRRLAELEPKAHAYDTLAIIARIAEPIESRGFSVDIAWTLKDAVDKLVAERAADEAAREQSSAD